MTSCFLALPELKSWHLLRLLLGLSGFSTAGLLSGSLLLGLLGAANGADAGDSVLTDISAVAVLGSLVGNTLVDPMREQYQQTVAPPSRTSQHANCSY